MANHRGGLCFCALFGIPVHRICIVLHFGFEFGLRRDSPANRQLSIS
jgi:hypothetical protein